MSVEYLWLAQMVCDSVEELGRDCSVEGGARPDFELLWELESPRELVAWLKWEQD